MRAVTSSQGSVFVGDHDEPAGTGELITVTSAGICGSDLHLIASGLSGVILGHEFGGFKLMGVAAHNVNFDALIGEHGCCE